MGGNECIVAVAGMKMLEGVALLLAFGVFQEI